MYFAVGFVLRKPNPLAVWGFEVHGYPYKGVFVAVGKAPRKYQFVLRRGWRSNYGTKAGQGGLESDDFDQDSTDPSLFGEDMAGGFLCHTDKQPVAVEEACRFRLAGLSLLPFLFSPNLEAKYLAEGKAEEVEQCRKRLLQMGVWYPIELRIGDKEVGYGVLELSQADPNGVGVGRIRFVYEDSWDSADTRVQLHRHGRHVGEADWSREE